MSPVPQPAALAELERLMHIQKPTLDDLDRGENIVLAIELVGLAERTSSKLRMADIDRAHFDDLGIVYSHVDANPPMISVAEAA